MLPAEKFRLEKAIPWTEIEFKFIQDGKLKYTFNKNQSLAERFAQAMELGDKSQFFSEIKIEEKSHGFSFCAVLASPEMRKNDKKNIYIFVNGRRIWEYSLVQAIEYGSQGYFPNGTFPQAALFLQIEPHLVDFNIHPAKREAKFRDIGTIHHSVSTAVRDFYRQSSIANMLNQLNGEESERENEKFEEISFNFGEENCKNENNFAPQTNFLENEDLDKLEKIPGVGKKTASKMILALKGKLKLKEENSIIINNSKVNEYQDVINSLVNMGYDKKLTETKVMQIVQRVSSDNDYNQKSQSQKEEIIFRKAIVELA